MQKTLSKIRLFEENSDEPLTPPSNTLVNVLLHRVPCIELCSVIRLYPKMADHPWYVKRAQRHIPAGMEMRKEKGDVPPFSHPPHLWPVSSGY